MILQNKHLKCTKCERDILQNDSVCYFGAKHDLSLFFCSCYANAVLQCLTCTKPLIIYLLRQSHSRAGTCFFVNFLFVNLLNKTPFWLKQKAIDDPMCFSGCAKDWCLMCELEQLVMMLRQSGGPLSPLNILMYIRSLNTQIGDGSQEDAHEFLRSFST